MSHSTKLTTFVTALSLGLTTTAMALVPMNVTSNYATYSDVGDHRNPDDGGRFSMSTFDFVFGLRTFNSDEYRATLQATLPLRTLQHSAGPAGAVGSEIGGYRVGWNQTFWGVLGWDLSYAQANSSRLGLFVQNESVESLVSAKTSNFLTSSMLVRATAGPGVRFSSNYGPMYFAKVALEAIWQSALLGKFAIGSSAHFRHRQAREDESQSANLFTLQPQAAWEIVDDLWISLQYTKALARPIGFEQAMGDASLSGLYGDTIGFGLSTATF